MQTAPSHKRGVAITFFIITFFLYVCELLATELDVFGVFYNLIILIGLIMGLVVVLKGKEKTSDRFESHNAFEHEKAD